MAHVDVEGESATDVLFRGQLNRSTAEYHLCVEHQPLQHTAQHLRILIILSA